MLGQATVSDHASVAPRRPSLGHLSNHGKVTSSFLPQHFVAAPSYRSWTNWQQKCQRTEVQGREAVKKT